MNKRISALTALLLALLFLLMPFVPLSAAPAENGTPSLSAKAAVLIEGESGDIVMQKNCKERLGMASTTKIMTALVAAESLPLDKVIAIPKEAVGIEGSSVYLCAGELLSVKELLYALLLASANDAAAALAIAVSGSISAFSERMNDTARRIGAFSTHFTNPHGLDDAAHYTTALDLAKIALAALSNATVREIVSTKRAIIPHGITADNPEGDTKRYLHNHNKLLKSYDGAIGVKTGFTKRCGRCLVSAAERDGVLFVAVTLNASDDWNDHRKMLDYGFSLYERVLFFDVGEFVYRFPLSNAAEEYIALTNTEPLSLCLPKNRAKEQFRVEAPFRFAVGEVWRGSILASLTIIADGRTLVSPLAATKNAGRRN